MVTESSENYTLLPLKFPHFSKTIFAEWGQKNQRVWDRALYIVVLRFDQQIHEFSYHKIKAKTTKLLFDGQTHNTPRHFNHCLHYIETIDRDISLSLTVRLNRDVESEPGSTETLIGVLR